MITIKDWQRFQHYKNRKPPWIKLYRDILDDHDWQMLSDYAARLLIQLWLLASEENSGSISLDADQIMWRLRIKPKDKTKCITALEELAKAHFITDASTVLACCEQDATPETERETEKRRARRTPIGSDYTPEFELFWEAYPRKVGKMKAFQSWVKHVDQEVISRVMASLEVQKKSRQWNEENGRFIPHPTTWLNQHRWEDQLELEKQPQRDYIP